MQVNKIIGISVFFVFIVGAGYFVYMGRPVMKLEQAQKISDIDSEEDEDGAVVAAPVKATDTVAGVYSMLDVQAHAQRSDCWSAVGGNVYDLTTWVSRHPGGESKILAMCGIDGTSIYDGGHGTAKRPLIALSLLKIGTLKN